MPAEIALPRVATPVPQLHQQPADGPEVNAPPPPPQPAPPGANAQDAAAPQNDEPMDAMLPAGLNARPEFTAVDLVSAFLTALIWAGAEYIRSGMVIVHMHIRNAFYGRQTGYSLDYYMWDTVGLNGFDGVYWSRILLFWDTGALQLARALLQIRCLVD
ncbi:hypothetical protein ABW21_db0207333 [Orbilia brochopaga]|nr:hypothetical protein ABW21_db0207333 [Drechslerella brochopaga]